MVMNPPAMQETWVQSLDREDPLDKGMATHSSTLNLENSMDREAWQTTVGKKPTHWKDRRQKVKNTAEVEMVR